MKAAIPSMVVYMLKLDGRYEMLARNIPGDVAMMNKNVTAMRGFNTRDILLNSLVSQMAHAKPSVILRK